MSERINETRERESENEETSKFSESEEEEWEELSNDNEIEIKNLSDDENITDFKELLMSNNVEAARKILATDCTLIHKFNFYIYSPIHYHTIFSDTANTDMTKLLLSYGAPVDNNSGFWTTLQCTCFRGKVKLCELLLTNGAKYDLITNNHLAHFATNVEIIKVLIR